MHEGSSILGERCAKPGRSVDRVRQLHEVRWFESSAACSALDPRPDVMRRADADAGSGEGRSESARRRLGPKDV